MKNLIKIGIDKLLEMDFPIEKIDRWNNKGCNHKVYDYYPYDIAYRIAKTFINKPFNDAYSHFCKKVPIYQQREFFDVFNHRYSQSKYYSIDEEGIIRYTKENRPKTVSIKSPDYRVEYVHKVNNMNKRLFKKVSHTFFTYYIYSGTRYSPSCVATDTDFKPVVVSGYMQEFSSKNDYRYKRYNTEQTKRSRLERKKRKKYNAEIAYCMMTKDEIKLKELGALDELKILSHGFDLKTSFRNL
jgi:hypothetical protein